MLEACLPFDVGIGILEMVVMVNKAFGMDIPVELTSGQRLCGQTGIGAGLVKCNRVGRDEHSKIGKYGNIVLSMTVTVGRDIYHK